MRIGELAQATGTTTKTLRFYENTRLLPPPERTANGYRHYSEEAISRLDFIRRGRAAGLTLTQIREVINVRDAGTAPCHHVQELLDAHLAEIDQQIADLRAVRATVAQLLDGAAHGDPANCPPDRVCHYI
jgi:DNA-binding transcriptional MerR regulator